MQTLVDFGLAAYASADSRDVFTPLDISEGAKTHMRHLFKTPYPLKYNIGLAFSVNNPVFEISPNNITDLHPKRSGRATGIEFYNIAKKRSNSFLIAYGLILTPDILIPAEHNEEVQIAKQLLLTLNRRTDTLGVDLGLHTRNIIPKYSFIPLINLLYKLNFFDNQLDQQQI